MIRRARTIILRYSDSNLVAVNYLAKTSIQLSELGRWVLAQCDQWRLPFTLFKAAPTSDHSAIEAELELLSATSLLIWAGTHAATQDLEYEKNFAWGDVAGYYHFSIRNSEYMHPIMSASRLAEKSATTEAVPLYLDNQAFEKITRLPPPDLDSGVFPIMCQRRSYRGFSDDEIPLAYLAECLFAGLGITGFVKPFAESEEQLPFKMTPSGGGRNPYEAFVYVRRVNGLVPGVYHYSAKDHSLGLVQDREQPSVGAVVAGQGWFEHAAVLVVLVANFDRTMWKYPHPTGYRVVLLEAGHIAQNMLLAATARGLACTPTCAIDDRVAVKLTGCDRLTQSHVYTVALGNRSVIPTVMDPLQIVPNEISPLFSQ
ncbi:SagB/ThcOx family dehydrogenase [Collimonas sp. H4R21]|uniref:SagB/ThcOx family dehydrogenase n=1 Tax=Collimonas rhizosphaerae TaxID=3126357 RepID=A0ABU9PQG8_9BURK